ncbi:MAG: hydrogenase [Deltaproteobacteria bacterium]|nr:hydrogenase [Deltaproteobacteria bacterium]
MLKLIRTRINQGYRTSSYPKKDIQLHESYRGRPQINHNCDPELARRCATACPQDAIDPEKGLIDLGRCVFCGLCERLSEGKFISFSTNFELGVADPAQLLCDGNFPDLAAHSKQHFKRLFGRSLQLREVSAAGCNCCEADTNVLNTPFFDLSRFGIDFVASPRHADGLFVTGPVSRNMKTALLDTYDAIPSPKVVIATGSCALSGGPFRDSSEIVPLQDLLEVDLFIPGCPPHPLTILSAMLKFFKL